MVVREEKVIMVRTRGRNCVRAKIEFGNNSSPHLGAIYPLTSFCGFLSSSSSTWSIHVGYPLHYASIYSLWSLVYVLCFTPLWRLPCSSFVYVFLGPSSITCNCMHFSHSNFRGVLLAYSLISIYSVVFTLPGLHPRLPWSVHSSSIS